MDGHGTHHQRHHRIGRDAQGQQGDEGGLRTGIVGRFRSCHTADIALTERHFTGLELRFLLDGVGCKSGQQGPATRQDAEDGAQSRATQNGGDHQFDVRQGGEQALHFGGVNLAVFFGLRQVGDDLAVAKHAHGNHHKANAIGEFRDIKAEAGHTGVDVGAHQTHQQAQNDHGNRLDQRARRQHHGTDQAQHHQREVFGRAKLEGQLGQRCSKGGQDQSAHRTSEERAQARSGQRRPRSAFSGHLVAIDHGHHRGRLSR